MRYDGSAIIFTANVGIEFYLGKGWSLGGNWMYAWWKNDKRHRYWRVYGGEIGLRKYLGLRSAGIPLAGHHIGIYGQMVTYDFEMGGRGYMGGRPGGTFWNKANYGVGLEYGYSLPVGRRLNLDFSLCNYPVPKAIRVKPPLSLGRTNGVFWSLPIRNDHPQEHTRNKCLPNNRVPEKSQDSVSVLPASLWQVIISVFMDRW